jgi:hypothetical protein
MAFSPIEGLALHVDKILVALGHGAFGSHLGVAFHRGGGNAPSLMHLRWHKQLTVELVSNNLPQCWVACELALPQLASKQMVGILRAIANRLPEIGYGPNYLSARGAFDSAGNYIAPVGSRGLTCSTFVVEIFRPHGILLINDVTWPETEENKQWAHAVCALLHRYGAGDEHLAAVRSDISGIRIKPEEVAGASAQPIANRPLDFGAADASGKLAMTDLNNHCKERPKHLQPENHLALFVESALPRLR